MSLEEEKVKFAADQLAVQMPLFSARFAFEGIKRKRKSVVFFVLLFIASIAVSIIYFKWAVIILLSLMFSLGTLMRYLPVFFISPPVRLSFHEHISQTEDYPIYTVLVPLFKEANVLPQLLKNLEKLNWPRNRLDVKLVLEQADNSTRMVAQRLKLKEGFEIVIVPDYPPRTKGKACNYALQTARGEFVVIFDAEDIPDPDQLLRAWQIFKNNKDVACLQAPLSFYNMKENWLTRQFAIEYMLQFFYFLPLVIRLNLVPFLGGTSNHFRHEILKAVNGWDPYNVTEDADLGMRFHRLGYNIMMLPSLTKEEAVVRLGDWYKQRTRWIKGWLQTWLVAMNRPKQLLSQIGIKSFIFLQLLVPLYILSMLAHLISVPLIITTYFYSPLSAFFIMAVIIVNYIFVILSITYASKSVNRTQRQNLRSAYFIIPFYWMMLGFAAIRAIKQLLNNPYYWEKTPHGLSKK